MGWSPCQSTRLPFYTSCRCIVTKQLLSWPRLEWNTADCSFLHALRITAWARKFHSIVEGKEMSRISVLSFLWLLDPFNILLLWGVAANFLTVFVTGWLCVRTGHQNSSSEEHQVCWHSRDPKHVEVLDRKLFPTLSSPQASISLGRSEQAWVMCLSAQMFPHPSWIKKTQHDMCQKPLKHWLALTLSATHGGVGLQYEWEIKLSLWFLTSFASPLKSYLVHQVCCGKPSVFDEVLLSQWLTLVLHMK